MCSAIGFLPICQGKTFLSATTTWDARRLCQSQHLTKIIILYTTLHDQKRWTQTALKHICIQSQHTCPLTLSTLLSPCYAQPIDKPTQTRKTECVSTTYQFGENSRNMNALAKTPNKRTTSNMYSPDNSVRTSQLRPMLRNKLVNLVLRMCPWRTAKCNLRRYHQFGCCAA